MIYRDAYRALMTFIALQFGHFCPHSLIVALDKRHREARWCFPAASQDSQKPGEPTCTTQEKTLRLEAVQHAYDGHDHDPEKMVQKIENINRRQDRGPRRRLRK